MTDLAEFWPLAAVLSLAMLAFGCLLRWRELRLEESDRVQLEKRLEEMDHGS